MSTDTSQLKDIQNIVANELENMFLALERIQEILISSSDTFSGTSVMGEAYLTALENLWKKNPDVDAKRLATFVNKCKDLLVY